MLTSDSFTLVRHPKVLDKLRIEVNDACNRKSELTRNDLRNMNYLQNIIKESKLSGATPSPRHGSKASLSITALRLYPPVPVNTRTATTTTIFPTGGGPDRQSPVLIPKGAAVAYSVYSMHRRPDLYGMDAAVFRPERWEEDMPMYHDSTNAKWGYLPFNGGPRICLGSMGLLFPSSLSLKADSLFADSGIKWNLHLRKPPIPSYD